MDPIARFLKHVDVRRTDECWPWKRGKSAAGYGRFKVGGKLVSAHRFAYETYVGPIPPNRQYHGNVVMHTCDNPSCCNPGHLRLGRQIDNVKDMIAKNRHQYEGRGANLRGPRNET